MLRLPRWQQLTRRTALIAQSRNRALSSEGGGRYVAVGGVLALSEVSAW